MKEINHRSAFAKASVRQAYSDGYRQNKRKIEKRVKGNADTGNI